MVRSVREAIALRCDEEPSAKSDHHSLMFRPPHFLGWISWRPSHCLRSSQTLIEKLPNPNYLFWSNLFMRAYVGNDVC
jgi:hypothetical protein